MLVKKTHQNFLISFSSVLMIFVLFFLASCMPKSTPPALNSASSSTDNTNNNISFVEPTFPFSGTFVQEGGTQSTNQFALPLNFSDSFLIRGKELSQYLKTVPNTTRFCMVGKYTFDSTKDNFLILSAKPKSYTDLVKKTTEFYLQIEPSNDSANQNDCLTYNLTSYLFGTVDPLKTPLASFSLTQLCTTCNSGVASEGFKLYFNNGEAVPTLNLSLITLTISGVSTSTVNTCVESSACQARGYDCCLEGGCVTDGAIRPGALTQAGFSSAQIDVASNPNRFILYPQFYFVCANRPEVDGSEDVNDPIDPAYEAQVRLMELNHLYQCLNKVEGEFSYCTVKFESASKKIAEGIAMSSSANEFSSGDKGYFEDINFKNLNTNFGSGMFKNNIVKIFYGGQLLYEFPSKDLLPADGSFVTGIGNANDDLTTAQKVKLIKALPANANDDNLYLTFKVDGSCEKIGSSLARCSKTYVHNTPIGMTADVTKTTYHDDSDNYKLPLYADTSADANIIVKVSGIITAEESGITWKRSTSFKGIEFAPNYLYQNQTVEIIYYVTNPTDVASLSKAKTAAQSLVNTMCICATSAKCNLKPIYNISNALVNYECSLPSTTPTEPPANQTVYVSNKNIPHRYYDVNGIGYDDPVSALGQEGTEFSYKNNDILKPTNQEAYTGYTGFNEIYGSFIKTNPSAARPAKVLSVKKDKIYDLFANSGVFSTCLTCGSDYYSALQKIYPQSFTGIGGGYTPNNYESRRVFNSGIYRSDDLLYGRACFIPATMIPWSHATASSVKDQRRNRLAAQHFLFANGYNKDWYGFDYGSLIGSFDGVTWFSIGNQRRIKATSNKLFIALNAYYGDLNIDSNFNVTVSETTAFSAAMPDHDSETDGAECQQSHFCANDNDCFRQVGYDFTCQNVSTITTSWPVSDANGSEVIGSINKSLVSIVGGSNGQSKRCVYRGRGAPCHANLNSLGSTFNSSTLTGTLACSNNNMCQSFSTGSTTRFNDRIARFANSPTAQNAALASPTASDTFGLAARILGRPYDYYGSKALPPQSSQALGQNNVAAICIPGKNIAASSKTYDLNSSAPVSRIDSSDKLFGIGVTMSGLQSPKYLNACPATDVLGIGIQQYDLNLGDASTINVVTTAQNLSTNLLNLPAITSQNIFSSLAGGPVTTLGYQPNSCLRAPGASCFSDMDCAPSEFIASKVKMTNLAGILNSAEKSYWEEELVCGNPDFKFSALGVLNTTFNIKNNVCCREFGKNFTVHTETNNTDFQWCVDTAGSEAVRVAGLNMNINAYNRYSRVHTAYDKMTCKLNEVGAAKSFALSLKATNGTSDQKAVQRYSQITKPFTTQFKTLDTINQRTCCTKNWIRNWATTNGGGHKWSEGKLQTIDKSIFRGLNWAKINTSDTENDIPYKCYPDTYLYPSCEIRSFTPAEVSLYLKFFGGLELVGIPQVGLLTDDHVINTNDNQNYDGTNPYVGGENLAELAPFKTIKQANDVFNLNELDFKALTGERLYSAANYDALDMINLKKIFSEKDFSCCIPSGQEIPSNSTHEQCCTGNMGNTGASTTLRCCLPDYADLTVYLNRYVSSEGRGLPDSAYDSDTGYIKDPAMVEQMALKKNLCCSGEVARGIAIRTLPIPIVGGLWVNDKTAWTKRFVYLSSSEDNNQTFGPLGSLFDKGIRWNDHVYCVSSQIKAQIPAEK